MKRASRHVRNLLIGCLGIVLLLSALPTSTSAAGLNNRYPTKVFEVFTDVAMNQEGRQKIKPELIQPSVTNVTYQEVVNIDPAIAEVKVDLPNEEYVVTPHSPGSTTVEFKWTQGDGTVLHHKFVVAVVDPSQGNSIPRIREPEQESYVQLGSSEINDFQYIFENVDWRSNLPVPYNELRSGNGFNNITPVNQKRYIFSAVAQNAVDTRWVFKVTIKDTNGKDMSATYYKDYKINRSPSLINKFDRTLHLIPGGEASIKLSRNFEDLDNDELFYTAVSANGLVSCEINGDNLLLRARADSAEGIEEITITADDQRQGIPAHGTLSMYISKPREVGIAGTYPEVDNGFEVMPAGSGEYYMVPFEQYLPSYAELEQKVASGNARKGELTSGGSLTFIIDQQKGQSKGLDEGQYGLYLFDGTTVKLERAIELSGKEKVIRELKELAAARGESSYQIVDAQQWLFTKGDNNFVRAKIVMALLAE
ncbi:hypothetical protein AZ66_18060 [Paenibacillus sp. E194]|uniref:hypothetical protein n=1 Tax=Paenibacillus sp. E194 TaxID=1458845 RepID=UPI0005C95AB0|nr:hypothetical protein [Paenibacillus sp. E194]KJB86550.1 hypothetical protein AZ66_18060 [Paenibacillus sp. E194]